MNLSRRGILIGGALGGGLLVAYALVPRRFPLPLVPREGEYAYGPWLKIAKDGTVSVAVPQLEMGQGVTTLLPQVAAWELGADWRQVAVEPAPPSGAYANVPLAAEWASLWMPALPSLAQGGDPAIARSFAERTRFTATAEGTALAAYEQPLRLAAAAAREVLVKAAAARWGVGTGECTVANGFVASGKRKLSFGTLAEDAAGYRLSGSPALRADPPRERPAQTPPNAPNRWPRLDGPSKVAGSAVYAADVRLPDMVFAAVHHAPVGEGARLAGYDPRRIEGLPGGITIIRGEDWVACTGETWWAAHRALEMLAPEFAVTGAVSTEAVEQALDQAVRKGGYTRLIDEGDADGTIARQPSLVARYDVAPALHGALETASCTARLRRGKLELWLASQAPELARQAVADALGFNLKDVVIYPVFVGGSFDARLDHRHAVEVAQIARAVNRPVQLTWSRWQENLAGLPRAPAAAILSARTAPQGGQLLALRTRIAVPAAGQEFGHRLFDGMSPQTARAKAAGRFDPIALAGATPAYAIPNLAVEHVPVAIALPAGKMRGQAHSYTAFFTESFIDELARAAKREPLSYRIEMLGSDTRLATCLQRVAALANWNGGTNASGQGLACHRIGDPGSGGRIAVIVTAQRDEQGVRVDRISAAVDVGRIVNLDIARQQIEGALIFGLGLAVGASTGYADGLPFAGRLADLGLPLLANMPRIEIDFVDSDAPPFDPGELGVAAIAPAVANALFSATGVRFRRLPLLEDAE